MWRDDRTDPRRPARRASATGAAGAGLAGLAVSSTARRRRRGRRPRRVPARRRLRRPAAARRADLDPGHPDPAQHARLGQGPAGHASGGRSRPTSGSATSSAAATFVTGPSRDHTVKVDVTGLKPATWYHYRFHCRGATSRVGRTRTAPAARRAAGATSASAWCPAPTCRPAGSRRTAGSPGATTCTRVVHLGDYLYEYGPGQYGLGQDNTDIRRTSRPTRWSRWPTTGSGTRSTSATPTCRPRTRSSPGSSPGTTTRSPTTSGAAARRTTLLATSGSEGDYAARRARAHRAYDEWMPVRMDGTARLGDGDRLFRRLRFGRLAELSMLDLRTYRSEQVSSPAPPAPWPAGEVSDPARTITGDQQLGWLKDSLRAREVQWKVVGNPVMIAPVNFGALPDELVDPINDVTGLLPEDGAPYNLDQWDGYTADRRRIFELHPQPPGQGHGVHHRRHPLRLGRRPAVRRRDVHRVGPTEESAGVEFVCTSVTSNNLKDITGTPPRTTSVAVEQAIIANNRHIKYLNFDDHGFSVLDLTPERAQMDWFVISDRADRNATISWTTSFATRAGSNRVVAVDRPVGLTCATTRAGRACRAPHDAARRSLVTAGAAGLLFSTRAARRSPGRGARTRKRAYVLVVDGCRPDEITPTLTPNLHRAAQQRAELTRRASSMWVMETIPNHVMMMTGVRPDRSGVPANEIFDRKLRRGPDHGPRHRHQGRHRHRPAQQAPGSGPGRCSARSTCTASSATAPRTAGSPRRSCPVSGHAPDQFTMDAALAMVDEFDPHLVFVNLGDIDRFGHADLTGNDVQLARQLALAGTDRQVQRFVDLLKSTGRWEHSVVIVLADHSMDWSRPNDVISLAGRDGRGPAAGRQGRDRRQRRRRPPLLDRPGQPAERRRASGCSGSRTRRPGCSPRTTGATGAAAARPGGRRRRGVLRGRLAVQRTRPDRQPDPRQPRPPGHPRHPVLHRRRPPDRAPAAGVLGPGAHGRRGADGRAVLRRRRTPPAGTTAAAGSESRHSGSRTRLQSTAPAALRRLTVSSPDAAIRASPKNWLSGVGDFPIERPVGTDEDRFRPERSVRLLGRARLRPRSGRRRTPRTGRSR